MADEVDGMGNKRSTTQHWEGVTPKDIIETIGREHGLAFIGLAAGGLGSMTQLTARTIPVYDALKRPPIRVVEELVRACNLRMKRVFGTELFGRSLGGENMRAVYVIYDPVSWNPLSAEFWQNALFSRVWGPAFKALTGTDSSPVMLTFHPADMVEPERWADWAEMLDIWAAPDSKLNPTGNNGRMRNIINSAIAALGLNPLGQSYEDGRVATAQKKFIEIVHHLLPAGAQPIITPVKVFSVEDLTSRNPSESELANPLVGTTQAQGSVKRVRSTSTSAAEAATLMSIPQGRGGQFILPTPAGKATFGGSDQVYLYYSANEARPSMVSTGPQDQTTDDALGFYPYTLTLKCEATFGLRIGMPACVLGFPRMDGIWEVASIEYDQGRGNPDTVTVTLRTARDIYAF